MTLKIKTDPVPLTTDADGVVRVGGTRVTLDSVIGTFEEGASAEEIVLRYPSLRLADVYSVIAYYLQHQAQVNSYLEHERELDEQARHEHNSRSDVSAIRERLLARRAAQTPQG